jgi:hypothetical protein
MSSPCSNSRKKKKKKKTVVKKKILSPLLHAIVAELMEVDRSLASLSLL